MSSVLSADTSAPRAQRKTMSKILFQTKSDEKIRAVKTIITTFLSEISKQNDKKFSEEEVENILLDIYNVAD